MRQMLESFINGTTYGYIKQQTIFHKLLTISCFKNYVFIECAETYPYIYVELKPKKLISYNDVLDISTINQNYSIVSGEGCMYSYYLYKDRCKKDFTVSELQKNMRARNKIIKIHRTNSAKIKQCIREFNKRTPLYTIHLIQ